MNFSFFDPLRGQLTIDDRGERVTKFNENHDERGRFAAAGTTGDAQRVPRAKDLSPEDRKIESRAAEMVGNHYEDAKAAYAKLKESEGGKVLNTDTARELSKDYLKDRTKAAAVQEPSSHFIKALYADKLQEAPKPGEQKTVLFTAGGAGAGKSSALQNIPAMEKTAAESHIIMDTTMGGLNSARGKIEEALQADHDVHVAFVQRDPVDALVNGALPRANNQEKKYGTGRTVPLGDFVQNHVNSPVTVQTLAKEYAGNPRVQFSAIDNNHGKDGAIPMSIDDLKHYDYNETAASVSAALEKEHDAGKISDAVYKGFKG